ncbi:hypothetical protein D3C87_1483230 [compost metagenome]
MHGTICPRSVFKIYGLKWPPCKHPSGEDGIVLKKRQRSPKSFPKESYFESIRCLRISTAISGSIKKSGGNSDRKDDPSAQRALDLRGYDLIRPMSGHKL